MSTELRSKEEVANSNDLEEVCARLRMLEQEVGPVSSPEELEALEREIRRDTDALAALLLGIRLQASLDSQEHKEQEQELIRSWPGRWKNEGYEDVQVRTGSGFLIQVRVRYYRRACDRRSGKRHKGLYAGLVLLGIHERCTPSLSAMVSAWSALRSSFEEVREVLWEPGVK